MPDKWNHPQDRLDDYLTSLAEPPVSVCNLLGIARTLAGKLDSDQIQDLFQDEMEADGYFDPLIELVECPACGGFHRAGFQGDCRNEPLAVLADERDKGPEDYAERNGEPLDRIIVVFQRPLLHLRGKGEETSESEN